ncbi:MAG: DUF4013 domain-containing protein [Peptococcaceae bacterium]|nr:DUF4013 domain-containing protein [Peptococcaceae bacterium]
MNIEQIIKFPFTAKDWIIKILIGGVLNAIPIINFFSTGYCLEVMKRTIDGHPAMPAWDNWGAKFLKGIMALLLSIVYMLPVVLIILFVGIADNAGADVSPAATGILVVLLAVFIWFVFPMALAVYVDTGNFRAAFKLEKVFDCIRVVIGDYLIAYVVFIGLGFLVGLITLIPVIGWLAAIFGCFYLMVVGAVLLGEVYRKAMNKQQQSINI